jgi:hypothetical protein
MAFLQQPEELRQHILSFLYGDEYAAIFSSSPAPKQVRKYIRQYMEPLMQPPFHIFVDAHDVFITSPKIGDDDIETWSYGIMDSSLNFIEANRIYVPSFRFKKKCNPNPLLNKKRFTLKHTAKVVDEFIHQVYALQQLSEGIKVRQDIAEISKIKIACKEISIIMYKLMYVDRKGSNAHLWSELFDNFREAENHLYSISKLSMSRETAKLTLLT